jgi:hypothetical protein
METSEQEVNKSNTGGGSIGPPSFYYFKDWRTTHESIQTLLFTT